MSKYYKALADRKPVTSIPDGLTRISVELTIAGITEQLRGPCSNTERVMLVHDRQDARDILALMIAEDGSRMAPTEEVRARQGRP